MFHTFLENHLINSNIAPHEQYMSIILNRMSNFVKWLLGKSTPKSASSPIGRKSVSIYDPSGHRKYLTITERTAFLAAARKLPVPARVFCETLAFTGARISEVLFLTSRQIDAAAGVVIFESLKKRRRGVYRA